MIDRRASKVPTEQASINDDWIPQQVCIPRADTEIRCTVFVVDARQFHDGNTQDLLE